MKFHIKISAGITTPKLKVTAEYANIKIAEIMITSRERWNYSALSNALFSILNTIKVNNGEPYNYFFNKNKKS